MRTQKLDADQQPLDDAGKADAGISRPRSLSAKLAIAELDVTVHDAMEPLERDWRALERDRLTSLHQGYEWCRSWVRAYKRPLAILKGSTHAVGGRGEGGFLRTCDGQGCSETILRARGYDAASGKYIRSRKSFLGAWC